MFPPLSSSSQLGLVLISKVMYDRLELLGRELKVSGGPLRLAINIGRNVPSSWYLRIVQAFTLGRRCYGPHTNCARAAPRHNHATYTCHLQNSRNGNNSSILIERAIAQSNICGFASLFPLYDESEKGVE